MGIKLFNKYHSRTLQFALDLLGELNKHSPLTNDDIHTIAKNNNILSVDGILAGLCESGFVSCVRRGVYTRGEKPLPSFPISRIQADYLYYILHQQDAALFLPYETISKIKENLIQTTLFDPIEIYGAGKHCFNEQPSPEAFGLILDAIRERRVISYSFKTKSTNQPQKSSALPWKLESSAYDGRWWIILYLPEEDRTVKARLQNISDITIKEKSDIPEEKILSAINRLLAPEPITLEVTDEKGALERCFTVFENQQFTETAKLDSNRYRLSFSYYRFDESEILRRLLYLGPKVSLTGPADMKAKLRQMLDMALNQNCYEK